MKSSRLFPCGVDQPLAPHGDGDAVGAGALERLAHQLVVGVLAGADDQPAPQRVGADGERVVGEEVGGHEFRSALSVVSAWIQSLQRH